MRECEIRMFRYFEPSEINNANRWLLTYVAGTEKGTLPARSRSRYTTEEWSLGALARLCRRSVFAGSSVPSTTAHAPGVGGIQLYGGP